MSLTASPTQGCVAVLQVSIHKVCSQNMTNVFLLCIFKKQNKNVNKKCGLRNLLSSRFANILEGMGMFWMEISISIWNI